MSELRSFIDDYYQRFIEALTSFDRGRLEQVAGIFEEVSARGGTLWVAGNGGSAAISDHTTCDTTKGTHVEGHPPVRSVSLTANGPMLTAIGNDISYDEVFRQQLVYYLGDEDAVLVVSSSGNSPNVVNACAYAKERGVPTIAFVGFSGGKLAEMADVVVHVAADNYGICEDAHQSFIHVVTQYLRHKRERS
jgi:phosphoheptose isomerase